MAGCEIGNGAPSSLAVASPSARRANMARRVGSARAARVPSRERSSCTSRNISTTLYNVNSIFRSAGYPLEITRFASHRQDVAGIELVGALAADAEAAVAIHVRRARLGHAAWAGRVAAGVPGALEAFAAAERTAAMCVARSVATGVAHRSVRAG